MDVAASSAAAQFLEEPSQHGRFLPAGRYNRTRGAFV
jgi:hypothetical protein